jgi:hypothetical protein
MLYVTQASLMPSPNCTNTKPPRIIPTAFVLFRLIWHPFRIQVHVGSQGTLTGSRFVTTSLKGAVFSIGDHLGSRSGCAALDKGQITTTRRRYATVRPASHDRGGWTQKASPLHFHWPVPNNSAFPRDKSAACARVLCSASRLA